MLIKCYRHFDNYMYLTIFLLFIYENYFLIIASVQGLKKL